MTHNIKQKEAVIQNLKSASNKQKNLYERRIQNYNNNPNLCLTCNKGIIHSKNKKLYQTKIKKFCNNSCAAKYNNLGVCRNKKTNFLSKTDFIFKTRKFKDICDWNIIQKYHENGNSVTDTLGNFNLSWATWSKAKKLDLVKNKSDRNLLISRLKENSPRDSGLKLRIIKEGLLENKCYNCGQGPVWDNKPISLHLHHINGVGNDNRIENLTILCPNCHSQTPNFGSKNCKKKNII